MKNSVEIKSSAGRRSLIFSNRNGDYFDVELSGDGIYAKKGVWGYSDSSFLVDLFVSFSQDWKGWEGERHWASIEGDLDIVATSDNLGHVRLDITILNNDVEDDWRLSAPLYLDAGGLDILVKAVSRFFVE